MAASAITTNTKGSIWKVVWQTNVYVRAAPSRESPKVAELTPNQFVVELARQGDWVQHPSGWSLSKAGSSVVLSTVFGPPQEDLRFVGARWKVVWTSNVYVRLTSNRESEKCAELTPGAEVIELARDGDWLKHSLGWTLTKAGSSVVLQEIAPPPQQSVDGNIGDTSRQGTQWRVVWGSNVYVRAMASRDSPKVTEIPPATIVVEQARSGDWIRHSAGWTLTKAGSNICLQEIAPVAQAQKIWRAVWGTNLFVRTRPERESDKCAELTPGARVAELERTGDWIRHSLGWTLTKAGSNICMVQEGEQTQAAATTQQVAARTWKVVWATNVYVRGAPDRESPRIAELAPGTRVQELERSGDWLRHSLGWTLTKAGTNICLQLEGEPSAEPTGNTFGDWEEYRTAAGKLYYYNRVTKQTQWTKPPEAEGVVDPNKMIFNPALGTLELAKPSIIARNQANESLF